MTSYVDLVAANAPPRTRCRICGVAIHEAHGPDRWIDNAGGGWCPNKLTVHEPEEKQ